jgi:hypothetical protein
LRSNSGCHRWWASLISGFVLHALGQRGGETLDTISNLGVTLMLFTIGLKLRLRGLLRPEVWAGTSLHTAGTVLTFVESHRRAARNVVLANATDSDFWERGQLKEISSSGHVQTQRPELVSVIRNETAS